VTTTTIANEKFARTSCGDDSQALGSYCRCLHHQHYACPFVHCSVRRADRPVGASPALRRRRHRTDGLNITIEADERGVRFKSGPHTVGTTPASGSRILYDGLFCALCQQKWPVCIAAANAKMVSGKARCFRVLR
jgi:hypothetical protein